jgi:hypothetical protein
MDELARRVEQLRGALDEPAWSEASEQALRFAVEQRLSRRRAMVRPLRAAALVAAAMVIVGFGVRAWSGRAAPSASSVATAPPSAPRLPHSVVFSDGSRAVALSSDARVAPAQQSPGRVVARLDRGAARFEVVEDAAREFTVQAGRVEVKVLGTVFTVSHEGPRVHVAVMLGRVEVNWGSGSTVLMQDSEGVFPPPGDGEAPAGAVRAPAGAPGAEGNTKGPPADTKSRWVDLARAGDFRAAYSRMTAAGDGNIADVPEELLLAADVARRAGHPDQAARHLERLLARYPNDTRADVAAFTLGRLRLQLGRPAGAGAAFERVAGSSGGLAEDALYRAVLAWEQAGDARRAERLRQRYFERYANGRYAGSLRKKP